MCTVSVIESIPQINNNGDLQKDLSLKILEILNQPSTTRYLVREVLLTIKKYTGIESVNIRLCEGEDYPYYDISNILECYVKPEMDFCCVGENKNLIHGDEDIFCQQCLCGKILSGLTNPDLPFFTKHGSFWTNEMTLLLATTSKDKLNIFLRKQHHKEGNESVALISLKADNKIVGILHLNDSRKNMFSSEYIEFLEKLGNCVGVAMSRKQVEEKLHKTTTYLENLISYANAPIIVWDNEFKITIFNHALENLTQMTAENVIGQPLSILFPEKNRDSSMEHIRRTRSGERWDNIEILIQRGDNSVRTVLWNSANICNENTDSIIATIAQGHDITERKQVEIMLKQKSSKLKKRIKEINCFNSICQFRSNTELTPQKLYQKVVELLPQAWLYSEITCARIEVSGSEYYSDNYKKTQWMQSAEIKTAGKCVGIIEVYYLEERSELFDGPFLKEERELLDSIALSLGQYIASKQSESMLSETNVCLIEGQLALENKNTALTELIQHVEMEKKDTGMQIQNNINRLVVPIISKLGVNASEVHKSYLSMLQSTLNEITSPFVSKLERNWSSLTPREVEICNLIRSGFSSKDIAYNLQTSEFTVITQRKSIRKKLGLSKQKINLSNYLQQK